MEDEIVNSTTHAKKAVKQVEGVMDELIQTFGEKKVWGKAKI